MFDGVRLGRPATCDRRSERQKGMHFTRLNESDEYRRRREELRLAELELSDHIEQVSQMRRELPTGTVVPDYELIDVSTGQPVRLSELFTAPDRALIVY